MGNPAELLHELFTTWHKPTGSNQSVRADDSLDDHVRAIRLLDQVEELLDRLETRGGTVTVWRQQLPTWRRIIFAYPNGWAASASIDSTAREHLSTLAFFITAQGILNRIPSCLLNSLATSKVYNNSSPRTRPSTIPPAKPSAPSSPTCTTALTI